MNVEKYLIRKSKPKFTDEELATMGIVFLEDSSSESVTKAFSALGMEAPDNACTKELEEKYGLSCISLDKRRGFILFKKEIDLGFIVDLCTEKNFYSIKLFWRDTHLETVKNAYLTEENFLEDVEFYVNNKFTQSSGAKRTYELVA